MNLRLVILAASLTLSNAAACADLTGATKTSAICACGLNNCAVDEFCFAAKSVCSDKLQCASKDGSAATNPACFCGTAECPATQSCVEDANNNQCGAGGAKIEACADDDGDANNTAVCKCGTTVCTANPNRCLAANNQCGAGGTDLAACAATDGQTKTTAICGCGNKQCAVNDFCYAAGHQCQIAAFTACADTDGDTVNTPVCACGTATCTANQYCTANDNKCDDLPNCANTNGTVLTTQACRCGNTQCPIGEYCHAETDTCYAALPFEVCPASNGSSNAQTGHCSCLAGDVCTPTEYCRAAGTCGLTLAACAKNNGEAAGAACACGTTVEIADGEKTTHGCLNNLKVAKTDACGDGVAAPTGGCGCGAKNQCAKDKFCKPAGDGECVTAYDACTNANGKVSDGAACVCADKVCTSAQFCSIADAVGDAAPVGTCGAAAVATNACPANAAVVTDATCICGAKGVCAKDEFCFDADANGTCAALECDATGLVLNAADKPCKCGTVSCAKDTACIKKGTGDTATYECLAKILSTAAKGVYDAKCDA